MSLNENENAHKRLVDTSTGRKCRKENVPRTILFTQALRYKHAIFTGGRRDFWVDFCVLSQGFMEPRLILNSLYIQG